MSWTTPRTWVSSEVTTAAQLNAHIRDNMAILKTPINDLGQIVALDSTYLADLSGLNLTGVAMLVSGNTFTGGTHEFGTTSLLKVPVGVNKYATDSGLKTPGSLWLDGDYLHHVDGTRQEWKYLGNIINGSAGAQPGFVFITAAGLRYTDETGRIRECVSSSPQHLDASARGGSVWVESSWVYWVDEAGAQVRQGHQDIVHSDHSDHVDAPSHGDHSDHTDVAHSDTTHSDHTDHTDHTDGPGHADVTPHGDIAHVDVTHGDVTNPHADHSDHTDHTDHGDVATDSRPVTVP